MTAATTIVVFTDTFPFGSKESSFLCPEIPYLQAQFDRVIIVPIRKKGLCISLPEGIIVNESLAMEAGSFRVHIKIALAALTFPLFWKELLNRPKTLVQLGVLTQLVLKSGINQRASWWLRRFIHSSSIDLRRTIFYTYWLGPVSLGVGKLKQEFPNLKVISRAHGFDIYEYRYTPPYIPLQSACLRNLDQVFFISENGKEHVALLFPFVLQKSDVSRLGVKKPDSSSFPSQDNIYRVVSCSSVNEVKRVDLLLDGLLDMAQAHPKHRIEWHHFGDGPQLKDLKRRSQSLPTNFDAYLWGYLDNKAILQRYLDLPFDIFVNVSSSEGIPVAIMEAISCGLPIVATKVGGTPEIVSDLNGSLLPKNPTSQQIAETIWKLLSNSISLAKKREMSLVIWREKFNANENYDSFAKKLRSFL